MSITRTMLFTPANHARRMEKTRDLPVDAVILDLEDAVAIAEKPAARATARAWLAQSRGRRRAFVRINGLRTPFALGDMEGVVGPGLDGIVLPKTESAADVLTADFIISSYERDRGMTPGTVEIMPILETARGVELVAEIARATPRVKKLSFGGGDFSLDTRTPWSHENPLLLWARAQVAIASRSAELEPPIDSVFPRLEDEAGLRRDAGEARNMGYQGKMVIHPSQVDIVNATFTPSREEVASATEICDAFDEAERNGSAAIVVKGVFVDYPIVYRARHILETARELELARETEKVGAL
jgi:citrate lyase subunit beta/citryl-CoA lyase